MEHILKCHDIFKTDFVRGENCHLFDAQDREYVDFESGCWSTALGNGYERVVRVMQEQLKQIVHIGTRFPNQITEDAALEVLEIAGIRDGKCVFLCSGSEAVEFGVTVLRRVTGRKKLLTFTSSYLGSYGSAGNKTGEDWVLFDWWAHPDWETDHSLDELPFDEIGGFVFEPGGSGIGFVKFPPKPLVEEIIQRTCQSGGLVMANEITTGMGRTGKWFGFQHYGVRPDVVAAGKGLGNGYPVSVVAMDKAVALKLEADDFHYTQSHQNDPMGSVVAREVIRVMREEQWIEKGAATGAFLLEGLQALAQKYDIVKEARGRGMLLVLELHAREGFTARDFCLALQDKGFLTGYYLAGNVLRFDPALTMEKADVVRLLDCMDGILKTVKR